MNSSVELVHRTRGPIAECIHRGHMVVADADGRVIRSLGDPFYVTYARSSAKPLQAIPVLAEGAAERFGFEPSDIALICSSHNGEERHVEGVKRLLAKIGIDESSLQCGAHPPLFKASAEALRASGIAPSALHNTCSGKHSGMLALAKHLGAPLENYKRRDHPVQQIMLRTVASFAGLRPEDIQLGIDGCGVPVFGLPIASLAAAYARFGAASAPDEASAQACRTIVRAIAAHPELIAGEDRFDTALIRATGGKVIGKMGADGVFAVSVPSEGLALVLKMEDGSLTALYPAVAEALRQLGWVDEQAFRDIAEFHTVPILNWGKDEVGVTKPVFRLV